MKYLFGIGIFLLPFIFFPFSLISFEVPRVWFFIGFVQCVVICSFVSSFKHAHSLSQIDRKGVGLLMGVCVVGVLSSLLGVNGVRSLYGNVYRLDGLITFFHLVLFALWVAFFYKKEFEKIFLFAISASVVVIDFITIGIGMFHFGSAVGGPFGQPNFLAGYLLVALPAVWGSARYVSKQNQRKYVGTLICLTLIAIGFTQSLGAIFGVGLFFLGIWCIYRLRSLHLLAVLTVLWISLFFVGVFWMNNRVNHPQSRERIVRKLVSAITVRPVLGWGWSNVYAAFDSNTWPMEYHYDVYVDKAHSTILEWFVTTGMVGGVMYLMMLVYTGKRLMRKSSFFFFTFLLFMYHSQTNVISVSEEIFFWICLGVALQSGKNSVVG